MTRQVFLLSCVKGVSSVAHTHASAARGPGFDLHSRRSKMCVSRAYPGSEFVVANNLAKRKKLEPNEINVSQGFNQKLVSTSSFVFNSLPARGNFCCLLTADTFCKQFGPRSGPTKFCV